MYDDEKTYENDGKAKVGVYPDEVGMCPENCSSCKCCPWFILCYDEDE